MSQTITGAPYSAYQSQAMIGMKADSMDDNVDTFAANAPIPFGVVVTRTAAASMKIQAGGGSGFVGIAIHDHVIGSRGGYLQYDAVSVLTRGRVWALVASPTGIVDGANVYYTSANGQVMATPGTKLVNAVFRSAAVLLPDAKQVVWGSGVSSYGALVELHYPFVDQTSTVVGGMFDQEIGPTEQTQEYLRAIEERMREREEQWAEEKRREEELRREEESRQQNEQNSRPRTRAEFEAEARRNNPEQA